MDRDTQNMGRASRREGRREGEAHTNGHTSGAGHEKETRTSQWPVRGGGGAGRGAPQMPDAAPEGGAGGGEGAPGPRAHQWPQPAPKRRRGGGRRKGRLEQGVGAARRAPSSPRTRAPK